MKRKVMLIWVPSSTNGVRNFAEGYTTETWGFRRWLDEYEPADYVLFGSNHSRGNPRQLEQSWITGTIEVHMSQFSGGFYTASAPHWADEIAEGRVLYPYRFGHTPLGEVSGLSAAWTVHWAMRRTGCVWPPSTTAHTPLNST